jgi:subtilisin family serine protease
MKKLVLILITFLATLTGLAQSQPPHPELLKEGRVQWVDNQLVVRFTDQMNVQFGRNNRLGIPNVDALLEQYNLVSAIQLFPIQKQIPGGANGFTTYSGQYVDYPKLTNIYVLTFDTVFQGTSIFQLTDALQQHTEHIVYAEPNYKFEMDTNPVDTLYQYQYNASQMNVDSVWAVMQDSGITDTDIVIAIIDTGVDTTHADLSGKQYFNMIEVNGLPGVDDDNNGFIDDVSGWDFVNLDNHAADDNSHGTHCAGIAVAKHNQIGIAGISKGAKYMPIKGLESSGGSASSVLAQGVVYAANNGADILSMSFGGYGRSLALENALAYAYAFSLPVGAAGNDGLCIRNDGFPCPDGRWPAPMYPGAYTFVLAAQATQQNPGWNGYRVWFSNYDFDGPTFTDYPDEFNYEVYAPGTYIVSSVPGGNYATFSGTSMACPAVAGSAAMYMAFRPNNNKEKLFIDYIMSWYDIQGTFTKNQGGQFPSIDLVKAIWPDEQPVIWNKGVTVIDSAQGDGDYKLDAGEVVQLRTDLKNLGSSTDSVFVGLRVSQYEDPTVINLIDSVSFIGSLSSYASGSNNTNMFELSVNSNVVNGRNISLNVYAWTPSGDTVSQDFVLEAQAGCEYNGVYTGKTVLSPSCDVIITGNTAFDTLVILPGTRIQIDPGVGFGYQHITANGKPDSMIVFTKNINSFGTWHEIRNFNSNKSATFRYCIFEYGGRTGSIGGDDIIGPPGKVNLEDCVVRYCHAWYGIGWNILNPRDSAYIRRSNFYYNLSNLAVVNMDSYNWHGDFTNNNVSGNIYVQYYGEQPAVRFASNNDLNRIRNNSFFKHGYQNYNSNSRSTGYVLGVRDGNGGSHQFSTYTANYIDSNYYGTTNNGLIESNIFDFQEYASFPIVQGSLKKLSTPKRSNHGHVFKVYLDSIDVNIFDNPIHHVIGLGKHTVNVVFNRPMNVSITPFVTYGVRQPYTQNIIQDSSFWSADSMIWTSNFNVTQLTSSDGYNRISIRNARDNEYFEVPIEDYRFEFRLNVAGALSTGFNAIGDSSEIRLNWRRPDSIIDLLGYNIYRVDTTVDANGDGLFGDTVLINTSLVTDTSYTDQNVLGGVFYRYHYTALRSSLTESQMSVGVWSTPYSSAPRVRTKKAFQNSFSSLTLDSEIDANFIATTGRFQFGTTKANLSNTTQWMNVGSDYAFVPFQASIQSVQPGIVYYYRAQGQNSLGLRSGLIDSILTKSIPQLQVSGPNGPCVGSTITPVVSVTSPDTTLMLTYQVNNGPVMSSPPTHVVANTDPIIFTVNATGVYTQATSQSVTITPLSTLNAPISLVASGATTFCQGGSVTLSAPTGVSAVSWSNGQSGNSLVVTASGTYSATYVTNSGCTVTSNPITVVVNPIPQPLISSNSGQMTFCAGGSLVLNATIGASGYQWFRNGTAITGATSSNFTALLPGTYTVQTTSSSGCIGLSAAVQVQEIALPSATISSSASTPTCVGDTVTLTAPSGLSYLWSNGATTQSIEVWTSGSFTVQVTNSSGCTANSTATQVAFNPIPSMAITSSGPLAICPNYSVTLTAAPGFANYVWNNGATTQSIIVTNSGSYSATGFTSSGCQATSAATTVSVNALPVATITASGSTSLCAGDQVTLSAPAGMSYLWSTGATTQTIAVSQAGNYTVQVTNASGCQATSAATTVSVNALPVATITASGSTSFCPGDSVQLTVSGFGQILWNTGQTGTSIWAKATGAYSASVTDSNGCTGISNSVSVTLNPEPVKPMVYYSNNANLLISSVPTGNQWILNGVDIPGADSATWYPVQSGLYSVRVTNASGCENTSDVFNYVNIGMDEEVLGLMIYPNPTNGVFTVEIPSDVTDARVYVYDGIGRLIVEQSVQAQKERIDLSPFANGVYRVTLIWDDGARTQSLVKN